MADVAPAPVSPAAAPREPGAPVGRDEIDPELVNLRVPGPRFGIVSSAGIAVLCLYLVVRLVPDLGFSRDDDTPRKTAVSELDGDLENRYVETPLAIVRGHAVRLGPAKVGVGMRAVPVAGTNDRTWLLMSGDGWASAAPNAPYAGRLRELDDLPLADALRQQVREHPGPSFATPAEARRAGSGGTLATVTGDTVQVAANDRVELDLAKPDAAVVVITYSKKLPGLAAWVEAFTAAGIPMKGEPRDVTDDTARIDVMIGADETRAKLDAAQIYARVEPVNTTVALTWSAYTAAGDGPLVVDGTTIDRTRIDLVRVFAARSVPAGAHLLVVGEAPADYWYVLPLALGLALVAALALWAFVRAVKRELATPKAA
jgi:hypothetical protein